MLVLIFYKDNRVKCGTDYTYVTNLKTIRGVENRYKQLIENKVKEGYNYKVINKYTWKNNKYYKGILL